MDVQYVAPKTLDEAIRAFAAAAGAGRILAGGTDLLVQMRSGVVTPGMIVDIKKIAEMTAIEETAEGGFRIGAAVSGAVLREHPSFGKVWPGVLEAINLIGSTQVQGRASAGGNLCNGSPAGDSVPAMVAAGAIVTMQGPNGRREIAGGEGARRAGPHQSRARRDPRQLHPAAAAEGLERRLPAHDPAHRDGHRRRRRRRQPDDRRTAPVTAARVGLGAVAPTVLLVEDAAKALIGTQARRRGAGKPPPPPAAPPAVRSTTSAAPSSTAPRSPACC